MEERRVFKSFACCHLTKGANRALLTDVQRGIYYTIPLGLSQILEEMEGKTIEDVKKQFESEDEKIIIAEYFDFLLEKEIIFLCPESMADYFQKVSNEFDLPAEISNAIIQLKNTSLESLKNILQQLTKLHCFSIELNITCPVTSEELKALLNECKEAEMEDISLMVNNCNGFLTKEYESLKVDYLFLTSITYYNSKESFEKYDTEKEIKFCTTQKDLSENILCGMVLEKFFTPNLQHYTESLNHNTCLNRKISIDVDGNIKNCPSMKESYGNIRDTTLKEAIEKPGFKKYWNITKDQIDVCKDCEFRHVCTDCRAYLEDPEDRYSKPLKCGYNPYTCEWEEWSINPLKQKAIDYYGMRDITKRRP